MVVESVHISHIIESRVVQLTSKIAKVSCVVMDGVTIGHPCCSIHNCHIPLASNRARFCPEHAHHNAICSVKGCESPIAAETLVCDDPQHQAIWKRHKARGQSRFTLHARLQRARMASAANSMPFIGDIRNLEDLEADEIEFALDEDGNVVAEDSSPEACPDKPATGNRKLRAQFGRKRTHNEQVIVAPCGVIISRATFYGAEALHTVAVSTPSIYYLVLGIYLCCFA